MSRTFVIPVTGSLTNFNDNLPAALVFQESARDLPGAPRAITRVYYPRGYDPLTNNYADASQEVEDLGVIDVVELWEKTSQSPTTPQNAPDDFIVNLSIASLTPDANARALVTVVDAVGAVRYPSFLLPVDAGAEAPVPGQPNYTKYGIPVWSGDRIFVEWATPPASPGALIVVSTAPADGVNLAELTAAFIAGCDCSGGACEECCTHPEVYGMLSSGGTPPFLAPDLVQGVTDDYTIYGSGFADDDVWDWETIAGAPGITINAFFFVSPNEISLNITVDPGAAGAAVLFVKSAANAELDCRGTLGVNIFIPE